MRFLVVQDYKENRRKCSLRTLEGRDEFTWMRLSRPSRQQSGPLSSVELGDGLLLAVDAPPLTSADREFLEGGTAPVGAPFPIIILDSTWRRLQHVCSRLAVKPGAQLLRRSLPGEWSTAYPRTSKLFEDPDGGLASVEAVFASTAILGEPRYEYLHNYRWEGEFLRCNAELLNDPRGG
jgi:pre-rRNA-processing protein TSR3